MELRQLRYFVRVVEAGSMGRAALALGVVTSALSQQISRLEGELSTRLLQRTSDGVRPTEAGLAFWRQAQLVLRRVDDATRAAQHARLSGRASVGLAPSTAGILGRAFLRAMRVRYPDVRLHLVESLSGDLAMMLNARRIDVAILFFAAGSEVTERLFCTPLLSERLYLIAARGFAGMPTARKARLAQLPGLPLILPTNTHGLRALINAAFEHAGQHPRLVAEIDGLAMLMDAVADGLGTTIQPGAALARLDAASFQAVELIDARLRRPSQIVSLPSDELSPAALAARVVLGDVARDLAVRGLWAGTTLHKS